MSNEFVVTFQIRDEYFPGMLVGLKHMSLSDAEALKAWASGHHRSGVIVNADTLEVLK